MANLEGCGEAKHCRDKVHTMESPLEQGIDMNQIIKYRYRYRLDKEQGKGVSTTGI